MTPQGKKIVKALFIGLAIGFAAGVVCASSDAAIIVAVVIVVTIIGDKRHAQGPTDKAG